MSRPREKITDREKAAILLHLYGGENDWKKLYLISRPGEIPSNPEDITYLPDYANKWKRMERIQEYLNEERDKQARNRLRLEDKIRQEVESTTSPGESERKQNETKPEKVDYYDPAEQRKQINRIIQEASDDPKTQLDAIKAIQQTQRDDRQAARDQKQVQSYLPLRCNSCPLMEKARKKLPK